MDHPELHQESHDFISFRDEFFDDLRGQRTGIKGRYIEYGLSWNHWIGSTIVSARSFGGSITSIIPPTMAPPATASLCSPLISLY